MKTGLAGRGHTEVSFFYQWRYDQQVRSGRQLTPGDPNTYVFTTVNLPNGNAAGMELAMQYEVSRGLQMGGSLGLLYTRTGPTTTEDGSGNLVSVPSRESAHAPFLHRGAERHLARQHRLHGARRSHRHGFVLLRRAHRPQPEVEGLCAGQFQGGLRAAALERVRVAAQCLRQAITQCAASTLRTSRRDWQQKLVHSSVGDPRQFGLTGKLQLLGTT